MKSKRVKRKLSRANLRRRLEQSVKNARRSHLNIIAPLTISRTVEMVNQHGEDWRAPKSQLLFVTGLGLTPLATWTGMAPFTMLVSDILVLHEDDSKKRCASIETNSSDVISNDSGISCINDDSSITNHSDLGNDDDCVCIGVMNFRTLPGYPSIKIAVTN